MKKINLIVLFMVVCFFVSNVNAKSIWQEAIVIKNCPITEIEETLFKAEYIISVLGKYDPVLLLRLLMYGNGVGTLASAAKGEKIIIQKQPLGGTAKATTHDAVEEGLYFFIMQHNVKLTGRNFTY